MKSKLFWAKILAAVLLAPAFLHAADLGDPAGTLEIKKWVKGAPVDVTKGSNVYVVEFWATWCPPCRTSIPHLTELQNRFKKDNVVIVGISDEDEKTVKKFVDGMASKMDYTVAIDDGKKSSAKYMEAYGIGGIPHAFVVQNQKVIWQGHPMDGLDKTLELVVAGKYDLANAKSFAKARALHDQFREAVAENREAEADSIAKELQEVSKGLTGIFENDKFDPAAEKTAIRKMVLANLYYRAVATGNDSEAKAMAAKMKEAGMGEEVEKINTRASLARHANDYFKSVSEGDDKAEAKKLGSDFAAKLKGEPDMANNVAWAILTDERVKQRDIPLALQIAKQACEDTKWESPQVMDTYAKALFDSGKKKEAVEIQKKAIEKADGEAREELEASLKKYQE